MNGATEAERMSSTSSFPKISSLNPHLPLLASAGSGWRHYLPNYNHPLTPPSRGGSSFQPLAAPGRQLCFHFLYSRMKDRPEEARIMLSSSSSSSSSCLFESEAEELQGLVLTTPPWKNKRRLSKQLSMCETPRDIAWERRRRQILRQERRKDGVNESEDLTDEDLHELKGCIELGFGFNEEEGQRLCSTLPALDLYFAVNRQLSPSPVSTPHTSSASSLPLDGSLGGRSSSFGSPRSDDSWKIYGPGDNPQQVKTKLRHWAQAVACSVMQSH